MSDPKPAAHERASTRSPLGLVVLWELMLGPQHVYGIQKLFEQQGKDRVVNVRSRASLYQALERLVRLGLVEVHETVKGGGYPERIVYAITEAGRETARAWLRASLSEADGEFPEFLAAVSILFGLEPDDARRQLETRRDTQTVVLADAEAELSGNPGLPRLFLLEEENRCAVLRAEVGWLRGGGRRPGCRAADLEQAVASRDLREVPLRADEGDEYMTRTIEVSGLEKRFRTSHALAGLNLIADAGQVTALLGPNGAGKTTFVRAVATLLRLDGGTLLVGGHDVAREPQRVRSLIGLAGQYAAVEPAMSGRENLEMVARLFGLSRRTAKAAASAVLAQLRLEEAGERLVRTYSGGMRRRLDLGASLVGRPRLLLLDEPTTGLDPRSRIELWDAIRALVASGTDVLLTTQYLDEADQLAGQIVIVDRGRTLATGSPGELKQRVGGDVIEVHARGEQLPAVAAVLARIGRSEPDVDDATRRVTVGVAARA